MSSLFIKPSIHCSQGRAVSKLPPPDQLRHACLPLPQPLIPFNVRLAETVGDARGFRCRGRCAGRPAPKPVPCGGQGLGSHRLIQSTHRVQRVPLRAFGHYALLACCVPSCHTTGRPSAQSSRQRRWRSACLTILVSRPLAERRLLRNCRRLRWFAYLKKWASRGSPQWSANNILTF